MMEIKLKENRIECAIQTKYKPFGVFHCTVSIVYDKKDQILKRNCQYANQDHLKYSKHSKTSNWCNIQSL